MISLDTETTGLDLHHGAKPFMVQICKESGEQTWWEWPVNLETRQPKIPRKDLREIQRRIIAADCLVLQNPKFDVAALKTVIPDLKWDWSKVFCTLLAGHLLASNQPHDLTTMALIYLGVNVKPYEDAVKKAVTECRRQAQGRNPKHPEWRIAREGLPEMPSAKGTVWKNDMWLPSAVAKFENRDKDDWYWDVTAEYGNSDTETTMALLLKQRELLKERGLWKIYLERLKILPVVFEMEQRGITINKQRKDALVEEYEEVTAKCKEICINLSGGKLEKLPVTGVSNALREVIFEDFGLESNKKTPTGNPSMDKDVLIHWLDTLPMRSKAYQFVKYLQAYRQRATALTYLKSYDRFGIPTGFKRKNPEDQIWFRLFPSLNPTGTDTLRWSSSNPNSQNVSKKPGFNLRYAFGPTPEREWYAIDYNNIELRIPGYEVNEPEMIRLFEHPNDPPFFGSYHLLVASILHPQKWKACLKESVSFKKKHPTLYGRTKNGNFADQYGAVLRDSGSTADRAYGVPGGQAKVRERLSKIAMLGAQMIDLADEQGFVETIPDKTVDPSRGYPLYCSRSKWGKVKPTIPLNYHVQSTAMQAITKAMIRVHEYLKKFPDYFMVMQVHDEVVLDMPAKGKKNQRKVEHVRKLMEKSGDDIGIPLTCSIEYHPNNWAEDEPLPWS